MKPDIDTPHGGALSPAPDDFEKRYGRLGEIEIRGGFAVESDMPLSDCELRDSAAGGGQFTISGHASVFNQWSLDLGGFREKIARGAFDNVLSQNPDVWHVWDHDTRWILSRTRSKTLELSLTQRGLRIWSRVAPTSYAADLRVLMERGDIDQASFAFTVAKDEWRIIEEDGEERIERTILEIGALYDVTTTAMGAYPQTDSQVARQKALDYARSTGRLPEDAAGATDLAPETAGTDKPESSRSDAGDDGARVVNPRVLAARAKCRAAKS